MNKFTYIFTESGEEYDRYTVEIPAWAMGNLYKYKNWIKISKKSYLK